MTAYSQLVRAALCASVLTAALSGSAAADPIIIYTLQPFGVGETVNGDSLDLTTATLTSATGTGTASVQVDHGSLGAYGESIGQFDAGAMVVFLDTLTITSSTLAAGTPVDLAFTLSVDYLLSADNGGASVVAFLGLGHSGQGDQAVTQFEAYSGLGVTVDQPTAVLRTWVGATVGLTAQLHAGSGAGNCCTSGYGRSDALHTMRFFVDPTGELAGSFSYTSESGAPYLTPTEPAGVPEPSSLLLVATGVAAFFARRRRA